MRNQKIVIAGGSGFIGQYLARYFSANNQVILLTRQKTAQNQIPGITYWRWNGRQPEKHWLQALEGADLLINLAGQSVNCRYTRRNRNNVLQSRMESTRALGEAVALCRQPPQLWINASTATLYAHCREEGEAHTERNGIISRLKNHNMPYSAIDRLRRVLHRLFHQPSEPDFTKMDFSVHVAEAWEACFFAQPVPHTRRVALRMAIVLGKGGILTPFENMLKWGLGGRQGNGRQWFSWIHIADLARIISWIEGHALISGPVNAAAPEPIQNAEWMRSLRQAAGVRLGLPAPAWLLEIGAALLGTETELLLKSRRVRSDILEQSGFRFSYPDLASALQQLYGEYDTPLTTCPKPNALP